MLTLMGVVKEPALFRAGVNWVGVTDPDFMFSVTWSDFNRAERARYSLEMLIGDPVKDKKVYDAVSPMTYIRNAKAPLLVLQGDNDIRVPRGQAEEVVATLKSVGATVEAKYYPAEGHGFVKRENQIDALQRTLDWLDAHLKGK